MPYVVNESWSSFIAGSVDFLHMSKDTRMAGHQARSPQKEGILNATNPEYSDWKHIDEDSSEFVTLFVGHSLGGGRDEGRSLRLIVSLSVERWLLSLQEQNSRGSLTILQIVEWPCLKVVRIEYL